MKKCPYCAEEIQDEAILCRYCGSSLTASPPAGSPPQTAEIVAPAPLEPPTVGWASAPTELGIIPTDVTSPPPAVAPQDTAVTYSYTGYRFVLGYTATTYAIWDRSAPTQPVQSYPRSDEGWRQAWLQYQAWEPNATPVSGATGATWQGSGVGPGAGQPLISGMAVASLVLGILWFWGVGSILAVIFGFSAKRQIDASGGSRGGQGLATAGIVLGFIGIGILALVAIAAFASRSS